MRLPRVVSAISILLALVVSWHLASRRPSERGASREPVVLAALVRDALDPTTSPVLARLASADDEWEVERLVDLAGGPLGTLTRALEAGPDRIGRNRDRWARPPRLWRAAAEESVQHSPPDGADGRLVAVGVAHLLGPGKKIVPGGLRTDLGLEREPFGQELRQFAPDRPRQVRNDVLDDDRPAVDRFRSEQLRVLFADVRTDLQH